MNHNPPESRNRPDKETLFRYQVVSLVLGREEMGEARAEAVRYAAGLSHPDPDGWDRRVGRRSIYRWLKAYHEMGLEGLMPKRRIKTATSVVLDEALLDYLAAQKREDPAASIPELIKRARLAGLIPNPESVHRDTVWRALKRMGVDTRRSHTPKELRCRRFAYAHRMDMVLCDGKHFRVGPGRQKRVALFFLDDATRMVLATVVGTSENGPLFLRGLAACLTNFGLMRAIYFDRGAGFRSDDSRAVLAKLGVYFIYGKAGYPQGHGKVERFNRRIWDALLRRFAGNPNIDADKDQLTLRLGHYTREIYNHEPHESLGGQSPWDRFEADPIPLRHFEDEQALREKFVIAHGRTVSTDHVVSLEGVPYEVPLSCQKKRIRLYRNVLDGTVRMAHDGHLITLAPVDLLANARRGPGSTRPRDDEQPQTPNLPTSAEMTFDRDFPPLVDKDGNYR